MDMSMPHLITEQVRGRVQFRHDGSVSVPKVVELEINPQLFLDGAGMELHGIDGLYLAIWQRVDQFGKDVMMMPVDEDHFTITVPVEVSPTFFAWIATFGRRVKILEPAQVVEKMRDFIQASADMYKDD